MITWLANTISLRILDELFTGIYFNGFSAILLTGLILSLANYIIKPILKILTLPINILSLGLFSFVINALVLKISFTLSQGAYIKSFSTAIFVSIILAIINRTILKLLDKKK